MFEGLAKFIFAEAKGITFERRFPSNDLFRCKEIIEGVDKPILDLV
jgi:hypothetical protein